MPADRKRENAICEVLMYIATNKAESNRMAPRRPGTASLQLAGSPAGRRLLARALGLLGLLLLSSGALHAQATTYHVATTGSDGNPGTEGQPFRTIQRAVTAVRPGETILVHAGTYPGVVQIEKSGTADRRITLKAAGDGRATLTAIHPVESCSSTDPTLNRTLRLDRGSDYWTVQGLEVVGGIYVGAARTVTLQPNTRNRSLPGRATYDPEAARTLIPGLGGDPADGVQILDNTLRVRGIYTNAARYGVIQGNEVSGIDCGTGGGIWLRLFSDGWTVRDNHVHDVEASANHWMSEGIRVGSQSNYNLIEDNLVERMLGPGRGINTDVQASWNMIRNNRSVGSDQGYSEQEGGWGNKWIGNVAENNRFGFHIGVETPSPAPATTTASQLLVSCNVSRNDETALKITAAKTSAFEKNNFAIVKIDSYAASYWVAQGNTWEGTAVLPPGNPPDGTGRCSGTVPPPPSQRLWGNVNRDGSINSGDALTVLSYVTGLPVGEADVTLGDVNADSRVTSTDALIILFYSVGLDVGNARVGNPAA